MRNYPVLASLALIALMAACSTASVRVLPGQEGVNRVVARDTELHGAEEAAVEAAQEYCEDKHKEAIIIKDSSKYTGSMDEDTRKTIKKASTAAQVLGGFGSPVEQAGTAGHVMTSDKDYEAEVVFRCN